MNNALTRENIIDILEKRIAGFKNGYRQNIALIGQRQIGKTAIIHELISEIDKTNILPVSIKINGRGIAQIINSFARQIVNEFLLSQGIHPESYIKAPAGQNQLSEILKKAQAFIPKTVAKIHAASGMLAKNKTEAAILGMFEILEIFHSETAKPCLIIVDEFQDLINFGGEEIFKELSKLIVLQKSAMYIITSSCPSRAKEILAHSLSLLFGNFEVLEVAPYHALAAYEFIARNLPVKIEDDHKKFLVDFTFGHPFYMDKFCREILSLAKISASGKVSGDILITAFENLLFKEWGVLNRRFLSLLNDSCCNKSREDFIDVILSISCGCNKIKLITKNLNKAEKIVRQKISRLVETEMLAKNGDFLRFSDKVFGFWIKTVYAPRQELDALDEESHRIAFRNSITCAFDNFSASLRRDTIERMLELLKLFQNESIQIERNKLLLSQFDEIKVISAHPKKFEATILAKSSGSFWVIGIKNGVLLPEDITEFTSASRQYGNMRSQRRLIISLSSIDVNAKLKALQEKIMTWEKETLNSLLELYNQPAIFS
ncbi:MAG: hypothetical protein COV72_00190 [Candidatus Omnitrophica bacterium CG11_big_fil_rev_8_21_14_0_20_42_13]|uniref:ATPase domain-containing protein n=1 Tax=Candidatus Ghiorseimicrobium undicola TaxID=1974746 RepID=A0A2H0M2J4_9BACT|nr:MAG: hypothetical protein COV72_00190 [Candidatus Omnitrophica bacterium CG11_big_fil_rev_8_21_14_0_20_42_13]